VRPYIILTYIYIHTNIHTRIHTYTHINTYIHTHTYIFSHIHTYIYSHTYTHTYIQNTYVVRTYILTYIYTYTHTHTHTLAQLVQCNSNSSFISVDLSLHLATYESMRTAFVFVPTKYEQAVVLNTLLLLYVPDLVLPIVNNAPF
jgi:hypothetical protein